MLGHHSAVTSQHPELTMRLPVQQVPLWPLPCAGVGVTACVAPCVSQTGAASDLCATFESGAMKETHQAATTSLLLGPRSPRTPGVSPPTQAAHSLRVEGRGCRGYGAGRRWVLEQGPGREEPCTFPQALSSAAARRPVPAVLLPGVGDIAPAQSWAKCFRTQCPSDLFFLTFSVLED